MSRSWPKIPLLVSIISSAALLLSGAVSAHSTVTLPSSANSPSIGPGQPIPDAFAPVPSGFDPLTASDQQLAAYGFPLPPLLHSLRRWRRGDRRC